MLTKKVMPQEKLQKSLKTFGYFETIFKQDKFPQEKK